MNIQSKELRVVPFEAEHVGLMDLQQAQAYMLPHVTDAENLKGLEGPWAKTGICDGAVVACAGITPVYPGRSVAWAYLSPEAGDCFWQVHCAVRKVLREVDGRVEATVDCDFENGHRWIKALGFKCEAERMRRFGLDGQDVALYARVKD